MAVIRPFSMAGRNFRSGSSRSIYGAASPCLSQGRLRARQFDRNTSLLLYVVSAFGAAIIFPFRLTFRENSVNLTEIALSPPRF
jgi:hypothetical protein